MERQPKVSIGIPVYNGAAYLAEAIESILRQTFSDFELIISDNASSDATERIARAYASRDQRIRYVRSSGNLGASANFRRVFELASGRYFKWAADDDVCAPTFVEKCVRLLDTDPSVVLAYSRAALIDGSGNSLAQMPSWKGFASKVTHVRFREAFVVSSPYMHFGLIRSDVLRTTPLIGSFHSSDRALLAELALHGRFEIAPEELFGLRHHPGRGPKDVREILRFLDPGVKQRFVFPAWRLLWEFLKATFRVRLPLRQRLLCWTYFVRRPRERRGPLAGELFAAVCQIPIVGPPLRKGLRARASRRRDRWKNETQELVSALHTCVPVGQRVYLVDELAMDAALFDAWQTTHFPEADGIYLGLPFHDEHAIAAVEQIVSTGGGFLVFARASFWWFEHYSGLNTTLRERFRCVLDCDRAIVFQIAAE